MAGSILSSLGFATGSSTVSRSPIKGAQSPPRARWSIRAHLCAWSLPHFSRLRLSLPGAHASYLPLSCTLPGAGAPSHETNVTWGTHNTGRISTRTRLRRRVPFWLSWVYPPEEAAVLPAPEEMVLIQGFDWELMSVRGACRAGGYRGYGRGGECCLEAARKGG